LPMLLHCNINDRGDGENSFAGQQRHRKLKTPGWEIGSPVAVISYETYSVQLNFDLLVLVHSVRRDSGRTETPRLAFGRV
jgi:hypothetical protein